jgi:hypothetical protein
MPGFMSTRKFGFILTVCVLLVTALGCGDNAPSNTVSGKVQYQGQPVSGFIHFVGADGKEVSSPIGPSGGAYTVMNPPLGDVTILIKPALGGGAAAAAPSTPAPGAPALPGMEGMPKMAASVSPPAKYSEASGGLKYSVKPGKQVHDIELTP